MTSAVQEALDAFHASDPVDVLRARLRSEGELRSGTISKYLIRDAARREAAISALVASGEARIEVRKTSGRPAVFIVGI